MLVENASFSSSDDFADFFQIFRNIFEQKRKTSNSVNFVMRTVRKGTRRTLKLAYKSLIRPELGHGAAFWGPNRNFLTEFPEEIQRKAGGKKAGPWTWTRESCELVCEPKQF